jgi:hypothetical protein
MVMYARTAIFEESYRGVCGHFLVLLGSAATREVETTEPYSAFIFTRIM